jgi:hypothetical protein
LRLHHRPAGHHRFYGAAVFGAGFGLCGTCPGGAIAVVATGGSGGLLVLAGLVAGLWLRGVTEGAARPGHHSLEEDETSAIAQKLAGLALRQQAGQADQ